MLRILAIIIFSLSSNFALADKIVLRADPWCPYNCEPDSDAPGFMVEIARGALAMYGHEVIYETVTWARALEMASKGQIAGAIGAVPDEAADLLYGKPLGMYEDAVALRRGETLDPDNPETYENWRIGVIKGYEYYGPIAAYVEEHQDDRSLVQYVSGEQPLEQNLRKLLAGRLDMVAEVTAVLAYTLERADIVDEVEIVSTTQKSAIYIGFSPNIPEATTYRDQLDDGVEQLRSSGRLAEIMSRYNLEDWIE